MVVAAGNELTDACYRSPASTQYGYIRKCTVHVCNLIPISFQYYSSC